jgi:murein L,D-transpeptidase YafK
MTLRFSPSFRSLCALAALVAVGLSGCSSVMDDDYDTRAIEPLSYALVSEMRQAGMTQSDAILIRIFKEESELEVWKVDESGVFALLRTYPICRWSGQLGPKTVAGDRQAPEGFYSVTAAQMNPTSRYWLSFDLGYPNRLERALGYTGDSLMVHGACSSAGCFAMTDEGVADIYALAREAFAGGQTAIQVQSFPFRMTPENLAAHRDNENIPFWMNLKEGYDAFEVTRQAPRVAYCNRRYVFNAIAEPDAVFEPLGACPTYQVEPTAGQLVAIRAAAEEAQMAALLRSGSLGAALSYQDGGMHVDFRAQLRRYGAERLAQMTSRSTPVSRPDAALADPYDPNDRMHTASTSAVGFNR